MEKPWEQSRYMLVFAAAGLAVSALFVAYQVLTDSSPLNLPVFTIFMLLCPGSLVLLPVFIMCIDCETGTGGFYFLWIFAGLANSLLYSAVGAIVGYLRYRRYLRNPQ
jgi:hypothetical protein